MSKDIIKYVYENDCPTEEESLLYDIFGFRGSLNTEPRFKPNGITDNRDLYNNKIDWLYGGKFEEWKRQRLFAKEDYQIDLMMGKIKIK